MTGANGAAVAVMVALFLAAGPVTSGVALVQEQIGDATSTSSLTLTDGPGHHIVTHFRMSDPDWHPTAVFAAEDDAGEVVMLAHVKGNRLHVSNGSLEPGDAIKMETSIGTSEHRLDIVFDGETYTLSLDQRESVTANTRVPATAASAVPDPRPLLGDDHEEVEWGRTRADWGDGMREETFTRPLDEGVWAPHVTGGTVTVLPGILRVYTTLDGVAYVHTPLEGLPSRYGAEATLRPHSEEIFTGGAALAGISGDPDDPTIHWAVLAGRALPDAGEAAGWTLYYHAPGKAPAQVAPAMLYGWHNVQVIIDETTDTLTLRVDDGPPHTFHHDALAAATHVAVGDIHPEADSLTWFASADYDDVAVYPLVPPPVTSFGDHIVTRFKIDHPAGWTTGVFALQDTNGDPVMHAKVSDGHLYVTDGRDVDGDPKYTLVSSRVGESFSRLDVVLNGSTYTVTYDLDGPVEAEALHAATQATPVADPHAVLGVWWPGQSVQWDRTRVDDSAMTHDTTFIRPLDETGFAAFEETDGDVQIRDRQAHQSPGALQVRRSLDRSLAYVYADRPIAWDVYHAEASFTPLDPVATPGGIALLAGVTGPVDAPDVLWSVVVERIELDEWVIAYRAPDGETTRVASPTGFDWRAVHAVVDEGNDTLRLDVDGGPTWTFTGQDLGTATRIAVGDVFTDPLHKADHLAPLGVALFDDVALYEVDP